MSFMLPRTSDRFDPASGLLRAEHFQMAYATNDVEQARALFGQRLGIKDFTRLEGPLAMGGAIRVELAWVGTIMYELIEATGPGSELYMDRLPTGDGFHLRHHHLGYLVHDQAQWDGVMAAAAREGWAVPYSNRNPMMAACFVDVPELGHYLEYLFPEQAGIDFFNGVARS
ncbi:MAG TPA: VOC family protein [Sphingobium sp.]